MQEKYRVHWTSLQQRWVTEKIERKKKKIHSKFLWCFSKPLLHTLCCFIMYRFAWYLLISSPSFSKGFPGVSDGKESACNAGSVQFSSVAQSCPILCDPINHSTPGLPVHHKLPESTQTHAHRLGDAIQPCRIPGFKSRFEKITRRGAWQATLVFLPGASPWTEEPGGLQSMGWQKLDMTE